ncbi:hypothetical protein P154DRAFT_602303 [Amniculicola lignicola CBS 123094]|uniref:Uncharacterized protein n=1 Tax=Amniculicola lignicola CBS 123094 TaxID=1392246 RepID=A0A6A5WFY1_9PLEO|nr:hypothetical protein P154DRAFT_602303 [Amniculicola lignicola CBS 123094]
MLGPQGLALMRGIPSALCIESLKLSCLALYCDISPTFDIKMVSHRSRNTSMDTNITDVAIHKGGPLEVLPKKFSTKYKRYYQQYLDTKGEWQWHGFSNLHIPGRVLRSKYRRGPWSISAVIVIEDLYETHYTVCATVYIQIEEDGTEIWYMGAVPKSAPHAYAFNEKTHNRGETPRKIINCMTWDRRIVDVSFGLNNEVGQLPHMKECDEICHLDYMEEVEEIGRVVPEQLNLFIECIKKNNKCRLPWNSFSLKVFRYD